LVAERKDPQTGVSEILAVGRLSKIHGTDEAEFALLVSDQYQGLGLGTELLQRLLQVGRQEQIQRINATILFDNHAMQHICEKLGFQLHASIADSLVNAKIEL